ncbi:MAG: TAT-variant-translocated molybdopterin oxidoreductase [Flavobacteriales bacterium]
MANNKTYWKGLDEKFETPEFLERRDNEFPAEVAVEEFLGNSAIDDFKTGRRDFLKFMGFSIAAATLAACESPVIKSIPYVNKPEDVTPGVANWYATTYYDGIDYGSILVKAREGRPIHIKGNKYHGINKSALTSRMGASVLSLYNSERLQHPIANGEKSTWEEVDAQIKKQLTDIISKGGEVRIVTNTIISPSTQSALNDFIASIGGNASRPMTAVVNSATNGNDAGALAAVVASASDSKVKHVVCDAVSYSGIRKANKESFGKAVIPDYNFSKAKTIVSVGADFLSGWLLSAQNTSQYVQTRVPENKWMSRHYQFESVMTLTGSNADVRSMIKPSEEGAVVASLYQEITGKSLGISIDNESLNAKIKICAADLKADKGESLVVAGANDPAIQVLVNAINEALGNYGKTIDLSNSLSIGSSNDEEIQKLAGEIKAGKINALIMYGVNPVYTMPDGLELREAISKIDLSVSFSLFADETASVCKFICPDNHYLESWNDYSPKKNHYAIAQPIIRPLYDTRSAQETLLVWAGKAKRDGKDSTVYHDYIKSNWEKYGFPIQKKYDIFTDYWNWTVHNGSIDIETPIEEVSAFSGNLSAASTVVKKYYEEGSSSEWQLSLYMNALGDGQQGANPWLQELPDPITKVTWDNYATMSPTDASKLGFSTYIGEQSPASVIKLTVGEISLELPVYPLPGQKPGTIGLALGYGRGENEEKIGKAAYQTGQYGDYLIENDKKVAIGKNAFRLASYRNGAIAYNNFNVSIESTGLTYPLACTQTHHTIMGRTSIVKETSFDFFKTHSKEDYNPAHTLAAHEGGRTVNKPVSEFDLWDKHPVETVGHRWGMTIDLSTCLGCSACVIACHSENNVPVVGKDEVRRSRDMHWLRLDRYFSSIEDENRANWKKNPQEGDFSYANLEVPEENPQVVHMPMLCQHCNHAPCETVCPVAATTHSNEGLNQMTYNRCIGTRYCANNCPYKVRRFNWFNYKGYKKFNASNPAQDEMGRMVLNPDVTVRSRGVMEKCSLCVQRIQDGKLQAKKTGKIVEDGFIQTACADACPTHAITFGDLNDNISREGVGSVVYESSLSPRSYQALEEVGVKPNIYYKVKVRNTPKEEGI